MLLDKFQYLPGNAWVGTDVTMVHFPVAQLFHLCILGWHDANSDLRCLAQVRTIERNRRNWPTPQPLPGLLAQALKEPIFHHIALLAIAALTIGLSDRLGYRESVPLRMQFPGLHGACLANRRADRSRPPSTQGDCFRLGWEASTSDPMARSRASPRSRAPWRGRCSR